MGRTLPLVLILSVVGIAYLWSEINKVPEVPKLENKWWGTGQRRQVDESIRNFKINVPDEVLQDLKKRLDLTPAFTSPLEGVNFEYGFNTKYLKEVVEFWKTKYNWREREVFLNKFSHFKTNLDGIDIHFIHAKPQKIKKSTRVLPLLLVHGWPGSVREFYDLIPMLTTPHDDTDFVFEVIAPSLPGYGFSEGASHPGMNPSQIALIMKGLMERLGFNQFYVQGGDWGHAVVTNLAILYPKSVLGLHSNSCFAASPLAHLVRFLGSLWPTLIVEEEHVDKMYPFGEHFSFIMEEFGYAHIQGSKPDTIGTALRDSPVGLAAYILEKFSTMTNRKWRSLPDGGLTKKFQLVDLLDNVMIYWVTGSITTSVRLYSEFFSKENMALRIDSLSTKVPAACAMFPEDLIYSPKSLIKWIFPNMVRFTNMPRGGHFAAFEEPQLLADDIWETVKIIEYQKTTNNSSTKE